MNARVSYYWLWSMAAAAHPTVSVSSGPYFGQYSVHTHQSVWHPVLLCHLPKISEDLACHYFVPWPKYRKHINSTIVVIRYPQFPRIYTLYTSYQLCFITMPPKKISAAAAKASTNTPWAMLGFICLHVLLTDMSSDALEAVLCLKR